MIAGFLERWFHRTAAPAALLFALALAAPAASAASEPTSSAERERPFCTRARCLGSPQTGWGHAAAFAAAAVTTGFIARRSERRG